MKNCHRQLQPAEVVILVRYRLLTMHTNVFPQQQISVPQCTVAEWLSQLSAVLEIQISSLGFVLTAVRGFLQSLDENKISNVRISVI
jgi:hypothetical protein